MEEDVQQPVSQARLPTPFHEHRSLSTYPYEDYSLKKFLDDV